MKRGRCTYLSESWSPYALVRRTVGIKETKTKPNPQQLLESWVSKDISSALTNTKRIAGPVRISLKFTLTSALIPNYLYKWLRRWAETLQTNAGNKPCVYLRVFGVVNSSFLSQRTWRCCDKYTRVLGKAFFICISHILYTVDPLKWWIWFTSQW